MYVTTKNNNNKVFLPAVNATLQIDVICESTVPLPGNIPSGFGTGMRDFLGIGMGSGTVRKQWPVPKPED